MRELHNLIYGAAVFFEETDMNGVGRKRGAAANSHCLYAFFSEIHIFIFHGNIVADAFHGFRGLLVGISVQVIVFQCTYFFKCFLKLCKYKALDKVALVVCHESQGGDAL